MIIRRMRRHAARPAALAAAVLLTASTAAGSGLTAVSLLANPGAASAASSPQPVLKLRATQKSITVFSFRGRVFLDPGIWLESLGASLEFQVKRTSYSTPIQISQILSSGDSTGVRQLPASVLDKWRGLGRFFHLKLKNSKGKAAESRYLDLCPNAFDPAKVSPAAPSASPFPEQCASDPFQKGMVWGIQKGWAVDPFDGFFDPGEVVKLPVGTYHATMRIANRYQQLFGIPAADASAQVTIHVKKAPRCCGTARRGGAAHATLSKDPAARAMADPPASALPDMAALPSWDISVSHVKKQHVDLLNFGATVWIGGNARLDVQGFRNGTSSVMRAYQYFWQDGKVIGRTRAGTMGFDSQKGHHHWHFEQFAAYRLLNSGKSLALRSQKQGFCIAPTDPVNLLLRGATWQPSEIGLEGQCGSPSALWVREMMPLGWGDTYLQTVAGQSFDITNLPNGTYYIEVIANPEKVLHETSTANDVSLRKVILGGTRGHRTVKVPAFHGIDPEK